MEYKEKINEFEKQIRDNCTIEFSEHDGEEMVNTSMNAVLIAFDEYLKALAKAETSESVLPIPCVVGRSEQLKCAVPDCNNKAYRAELCSTHLGSHY